MSDVHLDSVIIPLHKKFAAETAIVLSVSETDGSISCTNYMLLSTTKDESRKECLQWKLFCNRMDSQKNLQVHFTYDL